MKKSKIPIINGRFSIGNTDELLNQNIIKSSTILSMKITKLIIISNMKWSDKNATQ